MENSQFKFRAWDRVNKVMIEWDMIDSIYKRLNDDTSLGLNVGDKKIISFYLMQFTGLKDKYGKELYEGDIVIQTVVGQVIWDGDGVVVEPPVGVVVRSCCGYNVNQVKNGKVRLKEKILNNLKGTVLPHLNDGTGHSELNLSFYDGEFTAWEESEVVGNIYENPERAQK